MKHSYLTASALGLILAASITQPARADAETDALRAQIKALEARLDQMEKKQKQQAAAAAKPAAAPVAASPKNIDQRLAIVERNQEVAQEKTKDSASTAAKTDIGMGKGLTVSTPDRQYSINIRAYAQFDNRTFMDRGNTGETSQFLVRTARPIIDAKMTDYFNARMMWDFGQGNSRLLDAYFDFHPLPGNDIINVRGGQFKVPIGIERWQAEQEILFAERGQTTNLVPFRDIGAMINGQLIPDQLEYHVGLVNGVPDLLVGTGDTDNSKDVVGRLFAYPLRWSGVHVLEGLGLGVGGTYGIHKGTAAAPGLTTGYLSEGQRAYFTYTPASGNAFANGADWRLNPQLMYYNGPFSVLGEYVRETQEVRNTSAVDKNLTNNSWMAATTYVLTGEDASFDGVKPAHNFDPKANQWGAFELAARYSQLDVDGDTFPFFANAANSSKKAQEGTVGINWYFNPMFKINLDYSLTTFEGGAAGGVDRPDEKVVFTRAQFRF